MKRRKLNVAIVGARVVQRNQTSVNDLGIKCNPCSLCFKQCLQRWRKVLAPGLKKGRWTAEEDDLLRRRRRLCAPRQLSRRQRFLTQYARPPRLAGQGVAGSVSALCL